jgi:hypothetical protein
LDFIAGAEWLRTLGVERICGVGRILGAEGVTRCMPGVRRGEPGVEGLMAPLGMEGRWILGCRGWMKLPGDGRRRSRTWGPCGTLPKPGLRGFTCVAGARGLGELGTTPRSRGPWIRP